MGKGNCCSDYVATCEPDRVTCKGTLCPTTQYCCANFSTNGFYCIPDNNGCNGADIKCNGPEDCNAGDVCCMVIGGIGVDRVECKDSSVCDGSDRRVLCTTTGVCPVGYNCEPSTLLLGYKVCNPT